MHLLWRCLHVSTELAVAVNLQGMSSRRYILSLFQSLILIPVSQNQEKVRGGFRKLGELALLEKPKVTKINNDRGCYARNKGKHSRQVPY